MSFGLQNRRNPYFLRTKNACDKGENAGTVFYFETDIETPDGFTFLEEFQFAIGLRKLRTRGFVAKMFRGLCEVCEQGTGSGIGTCAATCELDGARQITKKSNCIKGTVDGGHGVTDGKEGRGDTYFDSIGSVGADEGEKFNDVAELLGKGDILRGYFSNSLDGNLGKLGKKSVSE